MLTFGVLSKKKILKLFSNNFINYFLFIHVCFSHSKDNTQCDFQILSFFKNLTYFNKIPQIILSPCLFSSFTCKINNSTCNTHIKHILQYSFLIFFLKLRYINFRESTHKAGREAFPSTTCTYRILSDK